MAKQVLSIEFKKKDGKLIIPTKLGLEQYKLFLANLPEGSAVECVMEMKSKDYTKAQLAKVHVCIKEIADIQGDTVTAVKEEVKRQCGLTYKDDKGVTRYKSFTSCSKEDMSNVIEVIIQMGNFLNVNFQGTLD